jgi:hypothetical protein
MQGGIRAGQKRALWIVVRQRQLMLALKLIKPKCNWTEAWRGSALPREQLGKFRLWHIGNAGSASEACGSMSLSFAVQMSAYMDYAGGISKCGGPAGAKDAVRGRQGHGDPLQGSLNSRIGPLRSPSDKRCERRESLWLAASGSSCTRCFETGQSSHRPKPAIHKTGGRI